MNDYVDIIVIFNLISINIWDVVKNYNIVISKKIIIVLFEVVKGYIMMILKIMKNVEERMSLIIYGYVK